MCPQSLHPSPHTRAHTHTQAEREKGRCPFSECDWSCNACRGPLRTDCLLCMDGYVLQEGVCAQGCSPGFYQDGDKCFGQFYTHARAHTHAHVSVTLTLRLNQGVLKDSLQIKVHFQPCGGNAQQHLPLVVDFIWRSGRCVGAPADRGRLYPSIRLHSVWAPLEDLKECGRRHPVWFTSNSSSND